MPEPSPLAAAIAWSVPPAGLDTIVAELRALRVAAGQPSYAEIVRRVVERRAARGVPEHERRLGRTTVYDCFRSGRRRLDVDLIVEVAVALGLPSHLASAWAQRCRAARGVTDTAAVVLAPSDVPAPVAEFVGREAELATLTTALADGATVWIHGMAGAGKTQLALRLAQCLVGSSRADAVFLDLRGHRAGVPTVEAEAAQEVLLQRLGVPDPHLLAPRQRAAALRAELGRSRTLLVLDDAADERQVVDIIGRGGPGTVVVTSRLRPETSAGELAPVALDGLTQTAAVDLLRRLAGTAVVDADPSSAARLTQLLGRLPLAVGLVASRLIEHPDWELTDQVALIERRLNQSRVDDELGAALALSFVDVPAKEARLLRLLAHMPLLSVDAGAAGALVEAAPADAARILSALVRRNLAISRGPDRVTLHTLVRAYAQGLAEEIDPPRVREAAFARLGRYLAARVWAAYASLARRAGDEPRRTRFGYRDTGWDADTAESWLSHNLDSLLSVAHAAAARGHPELLFRLSEGLSWWLNLTGRYREAIHLHEAAAELAAAIGDVEALATASLDLSQIYAPRGRTLEALEHLRRATRLVDADFSDSDLADPGLMGLLFNMTAVMLVRRGDVAEGIDCLHRAITIHEALGETARLLSCLVNLGEALHAAERFGDERAVLDRGVALAEASDQRLMLSLFLVNRSFLHVEQGEPDSALTDATRALDLATELGYLLVVADAEANLADAHRLRGDLGRAHGHASRAVEVARDTDDPHLRCGVLLALARVQSAAGEDASLQTTLAEAEELAGRSDDPFLTARVSRLRDDTVRDSAGRMR